MNEARTVYVTNFSGFSYKAAEKYGELVYMTKGYTDFKDIESIKKKLMEFIRDSKPEDYLLLSGNNLLCAIATTLWNSYHNKCNILHWNNNGNIKGYELFVIE